LKCNLGKYNNEYKILLEKENTTYPLPLLPMKISKMQKKKNEANFKRVRVRKFL
jgi:hypothetical protein